MNRKFITVLLAIILLGSVSSLVLYHIGEYVLGSALELANIQPAKAAAPEETSSPAPTAPGGNAPSVPTPEVQRGGAERAQPEAPPQDTPEIRESAAPEETPAAQPGQDERESAELTFTSEQVTEIRSCITAADKISASVLVLSKLSAEDIRYLYTLLEDGLTPEEKTAAKKLCYEKFSEDEIKQIYDLYVKYAKLS